MVTFDLHGNEDHEIIEAADGVFAFKTYLHINSEEIGMVAARCIIDTIRGEVQAYYGFKEACIISPSVFQGTSFHPMRDIMARAREWEERGAYCVSVMPDFAYADVPRCRYHHHRCNKRQTGAC